MKKLYILFLSILPVLVILFCFLGLLAAPNDLEEVVITQSLLALCMEYPPGTGQYGQCVLSRILYGGYTTLGIVLMGSAIVMTVGILLSLLLGRGKVGRNVLFESILNAVTAISPTAHLIIFISTWGNSISTMVVVLTISLILWMTKLVKIKMELEYSKVYVLCAVASGVSRFRILLVHTLPDLIRDVFRFFCLSVGEMILFVSGSPFINLSPGGGVIDWGSMVSEGRTSFGLAPGLVLYPMPFIFLYVLPFNLLDHQLEVGGRIDAWNRTSYSSSQRGSAASAGCLLYSHPRRAAGFDRSQRFGQDHSYQGGYGDSALWLCY